MGPTIKNILVKTEPVKWVRIHNLPSFVYFNHSQHVNVAGVECQTCHGPVQEYEIQNNSPNNGLVYNCHRKTEVKWKVMILHKNS
jgi:hypothetical protein